MADNFYRLAKQQSLRARSCFKLKQIFDEFERDIFGTESQSAKNNRNSSIH